MVALTFLERQEDSCPRGQSLGHPSGLQTLGFSDSPTGSPGREGSRREGTHSATSGAVLYGPLRAVGGWLMGVYPSTGF